MPSYVFCGGGNREICFSAASDQAAWNYVIENHATSQAHDRLFRVDRVAVERPDKTTIEHRTKLVEAANNITTNRK
jgi:hypothetical protein